MVATELLLKVVVASSTSVARVMMVGCAGVLLSRRSILDGAARRKVAELSTYCLLPALLFWQVSAAVARAGPRIAHWLILPCYAVLHCALGLALAKCACRCRRWFRGERERRDPTLRPVFSPMTSADLDDEELGETDAADDGGDALLEAVVMMTAAFPNSGGLPLALVDALCASSARSFLGGDECLAATVGYVSFYISVMNPLQWAVCPRLLATDAPAPAPAKDAPPSPPPSVPRRCAAGVAALLRKPAPPVWGAILGGVLGAVPGARDALLGPPGRASVLGGAVQLVSSAAVPVGIINLGGSVASKAGRSERGGDVAVPGGLLCAAVVIRLLVVPCLSCAATVALRLYAPAVVPPGDAALTLVLMLESTPPPAMQCMIFCQLFAQDAERPLGKVLVATYVASLVTLTAWIALFLSLLSAG